MKKIKIKLPDWADKSNLFVVSPAGEVLARRINNVWEVKTVPCARCGLCCRKLNNPPPICDDGKGNPKYLEEKIIAGKKEYYCSLRGQKPIVCVLACPMDIGFEECQIRWEEFKSEK